MNCVHSSESEITVSHYDKSFFIVCTFGSIILCTEQKRLSLHAGSASAERVGQGEVSGKVRRYHDFHIGVCKSNNSRYTSIQ